MRFLGTPTSSVARQTAAGKKAAPPPQVVVFSTRAVSAMLAEAKEHGDNETGGMLLGHRCGPLWFVIEMVDPGPRSLHQHSYFVYDQPYVNHLMNKVRWFYRRPLELLGLWHRHPGSMDRFSGTDQATHAKFLQELPEGIVSALLNFDPTPRLTVYTAAAPGAERRVLALAGDGVVPEAMLAYNTMPQPSAARTLRACLRGQRAAAGPQWPGQLEDLLEVAGADLAFLGGLLGELSLAQREGGLDVLEQVAGKKRPLFHLNGAPGEHRLNLDGAWYAYRPGLLRDVMLARYTELAQRRATTGHSLPLGGA